MNAEDIKSLLEQVNGDSFEELSPYDVAEETLAALGGDLEINGIRVPQPTAACLCMLQAIESPFLREMGAEDSLTLKDVADALYVICNREQAVRPIFAHLRAKKMFATLTDENAKAAALAPFAKQLAEFDVVSLQHFERFGTFAFEQAAETLALYLGLCTRGFEMIHEKGPESKKNGREETPSTSATRSSGWRRLCQAFRWPFRRRRSR